jgi:hypothetical protein
MHLYKVTVEWIADVQPLSDWEREIYNVIANDTASAVATAIAHSKSTEPAGMPPTVHRLSEVTIVESIDAVSPQITKP